MRRAALTLLFAGLIGLLLVGVAQAQVPGRGGNPFDGARLYVNPDSAAWRQVEAWRRSRPADAEQIVKIAREPKAEWVGGWLRDAGDYVQWWNRRVSAAGANLSFLVLYNIPQRDCSGVYSAGGARTPAEYREWIRDVARAIGSFPTAVVLEPDAVADSACLSAEARRTRLSLLRYATNVLSELPATSVYIDAGRSDWRPVEATARLLRRAGISRARGFALNVTGYARTRDELRYGRAISSRVGGRHFVIHTGRNGRGPMPRSRVRRWEDLWCNQRGRALGPRPTTRTGDRRADAYMWILHPGNSDGTCNGGPRAGQWWPEYALGLARRAAY